MKVIMVHSYKGGSGKTLFSINTANILTNYYNKRVLLIEGDLEGPVFTNIFKNVKYEYYINQYLKGDDEPLSKYIVESEYGFDIIPSSPKFTLDDLIKYEEYELLLSKISSIKNDIRNLDYDYVIIDLSPGVNYLSISSIILSDDVYVLMRPDQNSFNGTITLLEQIYANTIRNKGKRFYLVINQIPDHYGVHEIMKEWEIHYKYKFEFISQVIKFTTMQKQVIILSKKM